jgi:acyl carrier protein
VGRSNLRLIHSAAPFTLTKADTMNQMTAATTLSTATVDAAIDEQERIENWLRKYVGEVLSVEPMSIDLETSFHQLGLDSSAAVGMTGDLGDWLGRELDAAITYDHPSIRALAKSLAQEA